jgi:proteasome lid subunit RPN8/RPN11
MPQSRIVVSRAVRLHLLDAASRAGGRECCGFVLGTSSGHEIIASRAVSVRNAVARPGSFAVPDHERRRVERLAGRLGLTVVAVYHSHPGGDRRLSSTDRESIGNSHVPWLIATVAKNHGERRLSLAAYDAVSASSISVETNAYAMLDTRRTQNSELSSKF